MTEIKKVVAGEFFFFFFSEQSVVQVACECKFLGNV